MLRLCSGGVSPPPNLGVILHDAQTYDSLSCIRLEMAAQHHPFQLVDSVGPVKE